VLLVEDDVDEVVVGLVLEVEVDVLVLVDVDGVDVVVVELEELELEPENPFGWITDTVPPLALSFDPELAT
jgi:hypothetical protein